MKGISTGGSYMRGLRKGLLPGGTRFPACVCCGAAKRPLRWLDAPLTPQIAPKVTFYTGAAIFEYHSRFKKALQVIYIPAPIWAASVEQVEHD